MIRQSGFIRRIQAPVTYTLILFFLGATAAPAQAPFPTPPPRDDAPAGFPAPAPAGGGSEKLIQLNFRDSPLDQILEFVADLKGRTLIKSPGINATVTLKSQTRLTIAEALEAIDAVLAMNNITLVPMGDKFLKVVQTAAARQEGMPLRFDLEPDKLSENDALISQVVQLKYMEIAEAQPIIQSIIHGYGKIQPLERTNAMLITDTAANLKRALEILEYIDQPTESKVETRIYELRYAESGQVASRLNELIADSQSKEEKPRVETAGQGGQPAAPQIPSIPGVIRARMPTQANEGGTDLETAAQMAERGIIRGKVKIIADERTNIIFVISRPENFAFFDKIVAVLDRPVEGEIGVRVINLEYAKAEDVSGILNEFIGAASSDKKTGGAADAAGGTEENKGGSQRLEEVIRQTEQRLRQAQEQVQQQGEGSKGTIGRLSPNTKILADKRTNSLLLMGRKSDLDALELVLDSLDVMLAQVLIEAVILEVTLGDTVETGFAWLQRSVTVYNEQRKGAAGGVSVREPVFSFGGASAPLSGLFKSGDTVDQEEGNSIGAGLVYFMTATDLNLDAVVRLAAQSSDARVISTPVVLTTDNTEAKIVAAEQRPVVTSTSIQTTGQQTQNFEYRNIGITITVTPRINPSGFVMMEINQNADEVLSETEINDTLVPIIGKREVAAQIGVQNRGTVVLGGLVRTDSSKQRTKVPILGDIPLLGAFFRSDLRRNNRGELIVLLTPYVLKTPSEAQAETERLYVHSKNSDTKWHTGWSESPLPAAKRRWIQEGPKVLTDDDIRDQERRSGRLHKKTIFGPGSEQDEVADMPAGGQQEVVPAAPVAEPVPAEPEIPPAPMSWTKPEEVAPAPADRADAIREADFILNPVKKNEAAVKSRVIEDVAPSQTITTSEQQVVEVPQEPAPVPVEVSPEAPVPLN